MSFRISTIRRFYAGTCVEAGQGHLYGAHDGGAIVLLDYVRDQPGEIKEWDDIDDVEDALRELESAQYHTAHGETGPPDYTIEEY